MPAPSLELIGLCGRAITVLLHAVLTLSAATFAVRQVAETKRCSLEEIEAGISHQKFCRHSLLARRDVMLDPS